MEAAEDTVTEDREKLHQQAVKVLNGKIKNRNLIIADLKKAATDSQDVSADLRKTVADFQAKDRQIKELANKLIHKNLEVKRWRHYRGLECRFGPARPYWERPMPSPSANSIGPSQPILTGDLQSRLHAHPLAASHQRGWHIMPLGAPSHPPTWYQVTARTSTLLPPWPSKRSKSSSPTKKYSNSIEYLNFYVMQFYFIFYFFLQGNVKD